MKTIRFAHIVSRCGQPSVHLLLVAPGKDTQLMKRAKQMRVMTVHQALRGAGKDYGTVGLHQTPGAQVLIFPRSLKRYADQRVVGINYALLADSSPAEEAESVAAPRRELSTKIKTPAAKRPKADVVPFVAEATEEDPPTLREILAEIRAACRLLKARKLVVARKRLTQLADRIETDPELS